MRKIATKAVSLVLILSVLFSLLVSCSLIPSSDEEIQEQIAEPEITQEEMIALIKADAAENSKIVYQTSGEELYYELKNSGKYDNSKWRPSSFGAEIVFNFELAVNEEWYTGVPEYPHIEEVNEAAFAPYEAMFPNGEIHIHSMTSGVIITYSTETELIKDYSAIKSMTEVYYVEYIIVYYVFPRPYDYYG